MFRLILAVRSSLSSAVFLWKCLWENSELCTFWVLRTLGPVAGCDTKKLRGNNIPCVLLSTSLPGWPNNHTDGCLCVCTNMESFVDWKAMYRCLMPITAAFPYLSTNVFLSIFIQKGSITLVLQCNYIMYFSGLRQAVESFTTAKNEMSRDFKFWKNVAVNQSNMNILWCKSEQIQYSTVLPVRDICLSSCIQCKRHTAPQCFCLGKQFNL